MHQTCHVGFFLKVKRKEVRQVSMAVLMVDKLIAVFFTLHPLKRGHRAIILVVLSKLGLRCEQAKTGITSSWAHVVNQEG